jgi:hypothetical protein
MGNTFLKIVLEENESVFEKPFFVCRRQRACDKENYIVCVTCPAPLFDVINKVVLDEKELCKSSRMTRSQ